MTEFEEKVLDRLVNIATLLACIWFLIFVY